MVDWPSGSPGIFPVGHSTMWTGPLRNIYIYIIIVVNVRVLPLANMNGPGRRPFLILIHT